MSTDARAALTRFVAALERHFEAAAQRRSELDPAVVSAYDDLAAAFVDYDDALFEAFDEVTPFDLSEEDEDELDDEEDELDEDEDLDDELDDLDDDLGEDELDDEEDELDEDEDLDDELDDLDDTDREDGGRRAAAPSASPSRPGLA